MNRTTLQMLFTVVICFQICFSDDTYVGCFKEDPSSREFTVGGGEYNFNDINPKLCKALCKAIDYQYAALQDGHQCLCADAIETHSDGSQDGCVLRCAGNPTLVCGGYGYSSVFSTSTSVKTLEITDPEVFRVNTIKTTLADGAEYQFDFGDHTGLAGYTPGPQPHIYNEVGVYLVKAWVRNEDSGLLEARREVFVEAPVSDLYTKCAPYMEVDHSFRCSSRVGQGTNMRVTWNFNDGSPNVEMEMADATRFSIGPFIPRRLSSEDLEHPLQWDGIYMMPVEELLQYGSIEAWELYASKAGQIVLQVFRPLCDPDKEEKYCPYNRTRISRYWPCPPPTKQFCNEETSAFCVKRGSCQPFDMQYVLIQNNQTDNQTVQTMADDTQDEELYEPAVCEHESIDMQCPAGRYISVKTATYGGADTEIFPSSGEVNTIGCTAIEAAEVVQQMCNGKHACRVDANNDVFGDPCPGTVKYLQVYYSCIEDMCDSSGFLGNSSCNSTIQCLDDTRSPYTPKYTYGACINNTQIPDMDIPYTVIGRTVATVVKGYNMIALNTTDRIKVKAHDWIGYAPYHHIFPSYYPKAAYPPIGEVAYCYDCNTHVLFASQSDMQYLDTDIFKMAVSQIHIGLYLKTYISKPASSWVSHSYSSSGLFEINTEYTNALGAIVDGPAQFIKSEYAILSITGMKFTRDLGIYYACTDVDYPMHVEITQGTFVKFLWTFPDESQTTTSPYVTNGITDGPGVKTPDSLTYHFDDIGNYTTNVLAYNDISSAEVDLFIIARYCITGLNGSIILHPGDNTTNDWNLVMAGCWFDYSSFILTGNVVKYIWDHGDGTSTDSWHFDTIHQHYYPEPGTYTVEIKSDNIASVLDHTFEVTVVKPNYVNNDDYATSDIPTLLFCEVTWHTGLGLEFHWEFGDGDSAIVFDTGYIWHNYTTFDVYEITCTVANFPEVSDMNTIIVQDPVEGVALQNKTEVEATGDDVLFNVTWTRGNDVHFDWDFGDGIGQRTEEPIVIHVYLTVGYFEIHVNVSNVVSSMQSNLVILEVQERITNLVGECEDQIVLYPVFIQMIIDTGNKVWYDYHFGDGYQEPHNPFPNITHVYQEPETYTIGVYAYNDVSLVTTSFDVQIDSRITGAALHAHTPHIRTENLQARCLAFNGSNVIMSYDWGDGTADGPYQATYYKDRRLSEFTANHTYQAEGTFNITCFMENPWSSRSTVSQVILQERITAITFLPNVTVKGEVFDFEILPFEGGTHSVLFRFDYDDGLRFTTMDFVHQYVYRDAGMYQVSLEANNLVSTLTTSQDIFVQEYIEGFQLLHEIQPVVPGQASTITWTISHGTDVTYTADLGDDSAHQVFEQSDVGNLYSLQYTYGAAGSYTITISAQNMLNLVKTSTITYVEYPIDGLKVYIRGNSTTHTDRSSFVIIEIAQGTNVEYKCNYHDGSLPIITTRPFCKHMFIALGPHIVTVEAQNHLSSAFAWANETYNVHLPPVPHVIRGLKVDVEDANILGIPTVFMLYRYRGNRFNCTWQLGDNSTLLTDITLIYSPIIHTYEEVGTYDIWITCDNFYHPPVVISAQVTIQVPPDGLNLTSGSVGQYNTDLMFNITLKAGTDVEAVLNYTGDEFQMVVNELQGFVVVPAHHVNQSGWVGISITAWNMVPPVLILTQLIYIEAEITGLKVWADQPYVSIGSIVTFYAELNTGTNVTFEWSFETNEVIESTVNSTGIGAFDSKQYMYTELGLYAIHVTAFNEIGIMTHTPVLIAVQDSVKGFSMVTDSPVVYPDGVISFTLFWDTSHQILPTNASVEIYFGDKDHELPSVNCLDNLERITLYRAYYELFTTDGCGESTNNPFCNSTFMDTYMSGSKLNILSFTHTYSPGTYEFQMKVVNLASEQVFTKTVETQVPLVNLSIITHNSERRGVAHGQVGGGPLLNYFPIEYPVHFEVYVDRGTGSRYMWRLGDGGIVSTTEDHIEYRYYRARNFEVRLLASNVFGMEDMFTTVVLQESVVGLFAAHSGSTPVNEPVTVILFAAQVGTSPTYTMTVTLNSYIPESNYTTSNETSHSSNHTLYNHTMEEEEFHPVEEIHSISKPLFSKSLIAEALSVIDPNIFLPFDPSTHAVTLHTLTFEEPGEYSIKIEGSNYASYLSTSTTVHITEEPCSLPYILIYGGSKNISAPWQVKKNHEIMLISDVTLNCSSVYTASFHWDAYHVEYFDGNPLPSNDLYRYRFPSDIDVSKSDLVIPRRSLEYGTYLLQLTVTMDNYGKVSNKNQTYIEIIPSQLHVKIAGGLSVTIQENDTLVLNASQSYDPDVQIAEEFHQHVENQSAVEWYQLHGLQFDWYCKLNVNGSFPFEYGYEEIDDSCMEDGASIMAHNTDVLILPLVNLTWSTQYVFAVVVSKDDRQDVMAQQIVNVVPGEPPHLDIRCVRNCLDKINIQKHLALAVDCINCKNGTSIEYEWTVRDSRGADLQAMPEYQDFIRGAQSRYMVIQSPLFTNKSGDLLLISVRGYWSHSRSYGMSEVKYVIGNVPASGSCRIEPVEGIALQTEFSIECIDFYTEEIPLHYEYLYSTGQQSVASVSSDTNLQDNSDAYTLLFHSPEGRSPSITFPMGLQENDYVLDVRIMVKDAIGAAVIFDTHVQVFPPDVHTIAMEISSLRKDPNNTDTISSLDLFLGKGDTQGATKLISTIATMLNEEMTDDEVDMDGGSENLDDGVEDESNAYKTEVRSLLVETLSTIPVHNLDSAKQKSAAITQTVFKPNELTPETQATAADAYISMLEILDKESKEGTSLDIIEDASKYFFSGAFSLLEAASGDASGFFKNLQSDTYEWEQFWIAKEAVLNETDMPKDVPTSLGLVSDSGEDLVVPKMDEIEEQPWVPEQLRMSRNVTKKVFQIIDQITSTLLRNHLPGESGVVIKTNTLSLILKKENLEEKFVRLYHTDDGTWFKLPTEALENIRDITHEDNVISQLFSSPENPFSWHLSAYDVKTSVIGLALKDGQGKPLLVSGLSSSVEMLIPHTDKYDNVQDLGTADVSSKEFSFFHFNLTDSHTSIHIDIQPTDGSTNQLHAWLRYGFWPTEKLYDLKLTLPHPADDLYSSVYNSTSNMTTNPYTWFIEENKLYAVGSYYIGVRVKPSEFLSEGIPDGMNMTEPEEKVTVNVKIYTARCLYWSEAYEQWFPYGCEVGTLTTAAFTHCRCNHLTSFGGSFLIPPNERLFLEEEEDIIIVLKETMLVLYIVSGTGGLWLILILIAFICDRRHKKKIFEGVQGPGNTYVVTVFTALEYNASTTAKVYIVFHSGDGSSDPHLLTNEDNLSLRSGCIDTFIAMTPKDLGQLTKISLFHDGGGFSSQWHVSRVMVEEYSTGHKYYFLCNTIIKRPYTTHTFTLATRTNLMGNMHLFDTAGTSDRYARYVPLWYLLRRPMLGWLGNSQCVSVIFTGIFGSMLGVVALNEFIFPNPNAQPEAPTWMIDTDDIMTGIQAMVLGLPLQYILLAMFSGVRRKSPKIPRDTQDTAADAEEVTPVVKKKESQLSVAKKQASLEEVKVEVPETSKDSPAIESPKEEQVPDISEDKQAPDDPKNEHVSEDSDDSELDDKQIVDELKNGNKNQFLSPPDALRSIHHRSKRSSRHLARNQSAVRSIRNIGASDMDVAASVDSFASIVPESESDDSGSFSEVHSAIFNLSQENVNQNALSSSWEVFNLLDLPDVVLGHVGTQVRMGPSRYSQNRHCKRASPVEEDSPPTSLMYGGDGEQVAGKQIRLKKDGGHATQQDGANSFRLRGGDTKTDAYSINNNSNRKSKEQPRRRRVESLNSSSNRPVSRTPTSQPQSPQPASCCTELLQCGLQYLGKTFFPWYCSIFLWPSLLTIFGGAGFLTIFLTFTYHEGLVYKWVLAVAVSCLVSNLLVQPLLGVLICIVSCICRKPANLSTTSAIFEASHKYKHTQSPVQFQPDELKHADKSSKLLQRQHLQTSAIDRTKLRHRLKVLLQMVFMAVTLYVVYSRHRPDMFYWNQAINNMFVSGKELGTRAFSKVHTAEQFWDWSNNTLLPSLGAILDRQPYFQNLILLQTPRLRQLRVKQTLKGACPHMDIFQNWLTPDENCHTTFSSTTEDTSHYVEGWNPSLPNSANHPNGYHYFTTEDIKGVPYTGEYANYPGGGYTAQLGFRSASIQDNLNTLHDAEWIDGHTRIVFLEFVLYNAQVNFTSIIQLVFEMLPTGVSDSKTVIMTIADLHTHGLMWWVQMGAKGIFCMIAVAKICFATASILEHGREYISTIPHLLHLLDMIVSVIVAAIIVLEFSDENKLLTSYSDITQVYNWQQIGCAVFACAAFLASLNALMYLRVFHFFEMPINILQKVWFETCHTFPMYVFAIITFAYPGWMLFSAVTNYFHTIWKSVQSLHNLLLGGIYWDIDSITTIPYYIMLFLVLFNAVILFAFCAVILQAYKMCRIQETLSQFINFGKLSKFCQSIRNRIVTKRILWNVRLRKAIIARGWRRGRNHQVPVSYDGKLNEAQERMEKLLQKICKDNNMLIEMTALAEKKLHAQ